MGFATYIAVPCETSSSSFLSSRLQASYFRFLIKFLKIVARGTAS